MIEKTNSTVTVDLSKLSANIDSLREHIDDNTRIMAVVKADAYGHGATEVAAHIEDRVGAFAVNDIQEGIELREHGITKPILVFAVPEEASASQYRIHNLTATVSAFKHFDWLPDGTSFHLNFDTGMGRLGFLPDEAEEISALISDYPTLFCTGIYSHFATADVPNSEQVLEQQSVFEEIRAYFSDELTTHIANTGATAFYDTQQFNMVRLGIGLYGYPPGEKEIPDLLPILGWQSRLVQVKKVAEKKSVSYGASWTAPREGNLGIIPVGYDDGLKRSLSGKVKVRIQDDVYDIVGTITMNYCMVYLDDDFYEPGTKVELLYDNNNAADWASSIDTIPYEILTSINPKIRRRYEA